MYKIEELLTHFNESRISLISYTSSVGQLYTSDFLREFRYIELETSNFLQEVRNNRIDNIIDDTESHYRFSLNINPYLNSAEGNKELVFQLRNWFRLGSSFVNKNRLVLTHLTTKGWSHSYFFTGGVLMNCDLAIELIDTPNRGIKIIKNGFFADA